MKEETWQKQRLFRKPTIDMNRVREQEVRRFLPSCDSRKQRLLQLENRLERMIDGEIFLDFLDEDNIFRIPENIMIKGKRIFQLYMNGEFNNFRDYKKINFSEFDGIIISNLEWRAITNIPENAEAIRILSYEYQYKKLQIEKEFPKGKSKQIESPKKKSKKIIVLSDKVKLEQLFAPKPEPKVKESSDLPKVKESPDPPKPETIFRVKIIDQKSVAKPYGHYVPLPPKLVVGKKPKKNEFVSGTPVHQQSGGGRKITKEKMNELLELRKKFKMT